MELASVQCWKIKLALSAHKPEGKYYEDLTLGDRFETRSRTVTEADIVNFVGITWDLSPIHTDEEFAKRSIFKGRVAHGQLTLSMAIGLETQLHLFEGTFLAFLGMNDVRYPAPVRAGDTIRVVITIKKKQKTSRPDRGVVTAGYEVLNQRNETVMTSEFLYLLRRK